MAEPYGQKISGWITELLPDGIACEDDEYGLTIIRDKKAFLQKPFQKEQYVDIHIQQVLDQRYYQSLIKHPTKTWILKKGVMFAGEINTATTYGSFDLKEIDPNDTPFKSLWFLAERSFIQNRIHLKDLPTAVGDIITVEIRIAR